VLIAAHIFWALLLKPIILVSNNSTESATAKLPAQLWRVVVARVSNAGSGPPTSRRSTESAIAPGASRGGATSRWPIEGCRQRRLIKSREIPLWWMPQCAGFGPEAPRKSDRWKTQGAVCKIEKLPQSPLSRGEENAGRVLVNPVPWKWNVKASVSSPSIVFLSDPSVQGDFTFKSFFKKTRISFIAFTPQPNSSTNTNKVLNQWQLPQSDSWFPMLWDRWPCFILHALIVAVYHPEPTVIGMGENPQSGHGSG